MRQRIAFVLAAALIVVALALWVYLDKPYQVPSAVTPSPVPEAAKATELSAPDSVRTSVASEPASPAVEFLSNYWGDRWPIVKAELDAQGVQYAWRPAITVPWETAAADIEKRLPLTEAERKSYTESFMGWNGKADKEWLVNQFGSAPPLDETSWSQLQDLANSHAQEIRPFADELVNGLESETLAAWHSGKFIRAPYSPVGAPGFGKKGFYSKGDGYEGWTASISFTWDDLPRLAPIREDMLARVKARNAAVTKFLSDWRIKHSQEY